MPLSSASTIAHTRSPFLGDTVTPIRPFIPLGMPGLSVNSVQVSPPSVDLNRPLSGPPLINSHGFRSTCQKAAYRMRGLDGSIAISMAPALSLRNSTRSQFLPPSVVRYTPRCSLGLNRWPKAATYTMSGF